MAPIAVVVQVIPPACSSRTMVGPVERRTPDILSHFEVPSTNLSLITISRRLSEPEISNFSETAFLFSA